MCQKPPVATQQAPRLKSHLELRAQVEKRMLRNFAHGVKLIPPKYTSHRNKTAIFLSSCVGGCRPWTGPAVALQILLSNLWLLSFLRGRRPASFSTNRRYKAGQRRPLTVSSPIKCRLKGNWLTDFMRTGLLGLHSRKQQQNHH